MVVVSDTTAITNLMAIGRVDLFQRILGDILIPAAVAAELRAVHDALPDFIRVRDVGESEIEGMDLTRLGAGEREAILLARESNAELLVMDERKGRAAAAQLGLRFSGLLGLLLRAKEQGLVDSVRDVLEELEQGPGFYLSQQLKEEVIRRAGESVSG